MKSGPVVLRPNVLEYKPWIFQNCMVKDFM